MPSSALESMNLGAIGGLAALAKSSDVDSDQIQDDDQDLKVQVKHLKKQLVKKDKNSG